MKSIIKHIQRMIKGYCAFFCFSKVYKMNSYFNENDITIVKIRMKNYITLLQNVVVVIIKNDDLFNINGFQRY